jgi:hypothetical protein
MGPSALANFHRQQSNDTAKIIGTATSETVDRVERTKRLNTFFAGIQAGTSPPWA